MTRPDLDQSKPNRATWIAAGAALLGGATLFFRHLHHARLRAVAGFRYDEESGRGRAGTPASAAARGAGHETEDLRGGTLGRLLLLLGSVALCMVFAMVGLRIWVTNVQRSDAPALTAVQTAPITPPGPRIQGGDPMREIAGVHAREDALLDGYARLDNGRARIPVARAMALTVGQPLAPPP